MILPIYAILLGFEQKVVVWMDGGYLKPVKPRAPCGLLAACNAEQSPGVEMPGTRTGAGSLLFCGSSGMKWKSQKVTSLLLTLSLVKLKTKRIN